MKCESEVEFFCFQLQGINNKYVIFYLFRFSDLSAAVEESAA